MIKNTFNGNRKYSYRVKPEYTRLHLVDSAMRDESEFDFEGDGEVQSLGNTKIGAQNGVRPLYLGNFNTDPQGSYTGRPRDLNEVPVQDADDL